MITKRKQLENAIIAIIVLAEKGINVVGIRNLQKNSGDESKKKNGAKHVFHCGNKVTAPLLECGQYI